MADAKISALTAVTTPAGAQEIPVNDAGTTKKLTLTQIQGYCDPIYGASTASQGPGFASDTYLTGSAITIPNGRLQAGTCYECVFSVSKTAAGAVAAIINIRFGTAGTTSDTTRCTLTNSGQTTATDTGMYVIRATFRSVGSGTSAIIRGTSVLEHAAASTGLNTKNAEMITANSAAGFDSTVSNSIIGISVNGGTSAAWTVDQVQTKLFNLA